MDFIEKLEMEKSDLSIEIREILIFLLITFISDGNILFKDVKIIEKKK